MLTFCQICSKLLQSSFPIFHYWWRVIQSTEGITQGDPTAMAIYAIAIIPLFLMLADIPHLDDFSTKTAADADDFTTAGKNIQLKKCWDTLCQLGPKFGYYPKGGKSWFIIKGNRQYAADIFRGTSIQNYNRRSMTSRSSYQIH